MLVLRRAAYCRLRQRDQKIREGRMLTAGGKEMGARQKCHGVAKCCSSRAEGAMPVTAGSAAKRENSVAAARYASPAAVSASRTTTRTRLRRGRHREMVRRALFKRCARALLADVVQETRDASPRRPENEDEDDITTFTHTVRETTPLRAPRFCCASSPCFCLRRAFLRGGKFISAAARQRGVPSPSAHAKTLYHMRE